MCSHSDEVRVLINNTAHLKELLAQARMFRSIFVAQAGHVAASVGSKSRYIAQNYGDTKTGSIPAKTGTVQMFTQQRVLSLTI